MGASKRFVAALSAAMVISGAVAASAHGGTLTARPAGDITAVSSGRLSFSTGFGSIACNTTLGGGVFKMNLTEEIGVAEAAAITELRTSSCTEPFGRSITASGLAFSWGVRLDSFLGTLPSISGLGMTIVGARFEAVGTSVGNCLYAGDIPVLMPLTAGVGTTMRLLANRLVWQSGGAFCPRTIEGSGTFTLSAAQTITYAAVGPPLAPVATISFGGAEGRHTAVLRAVAAVTVGSMRLEFAGRNYTAVADCIGRTMAVGDRCNVTIEVSPPATRQEELNFFDNDAPADPAGAIHLRP